MHKRVRGVDQPTADAARLHRKTATRAEAILWKELRDRRLTGLKFRRQQPRGPYIVDFCCAEHRLIIEVDGESHKDQHEYDHARTEHLSAYGYRVLRFTNDEVVHKLGHVLTTIEQAIVPPKD